MNPLTVVDAVATTDNSISWTNRFTLSFVNTDLIHSLMFLITSILLSFQSRSHKS